MTRLVTIMRRDCRVRWPPCYGLTSYSRCISLEGGQDLKSFYDRPGFSGIDDSFLKKVVGFYVFCGKL
jgi:hypothetical protein